MLTLYRSRREQMNTPEPKKKYPESRGGRGRDNDKLAPNIDEGIVRTVKYPDLNVRKLLKRLHATI